MNDSTEKLPPGVLEPASLEAWLLTLPKDRLFYKGDTPREWDDDAQVLLLCYLWNATGSLYDEGETLLIERDYGYALVIPDWLQEFRDRACFSHGSAGVSVAQALRDLAAIREEYGI